jgi:hypothetical protein
MLDLEICIMLIQAIRQNAILKPAVIHTTVGKQYIPQTLEMCR